MYRSLSDAIRVAETSHRSLSEVAIDQESRDQGRSPDEIRKSLRRALDVMRGLELAVTSSRQRCVVPWESHEHLRE